MVAADGSPLLSCCRLFDRYTHHLSLPLSHLVHFYRAIPIPTAAARVERAARAAVREARAVPPREAREVTPAPIPTHIPTAASRVERAARAAVREARENKLTLSREGRAGGHPAPYISRRALLSISMLCPHMERVVQLYSPPRILGVVLSVLVPYIYEELLGTPAMLFCSW